LKIYQMPSAGCYDSLAESNSAGKFDLPLYFIPLSGAS